MRKRIIGVMTVLSVLLAVLMAWGLVAPPTAEAAGVPKGTIVIAVPLAPQKIDPHTVLNIFLESICLEGAN